MLKNILIEAKTLYEIEINRSDSCLIRATSEIILFKCFKNKLKTS